MLSEEGNTAVLLVRNFKWYFKKHIWNIYYKIFGFLRVLLDLRCSERAEVLPQEFYNKTKFPSRMWVETAPLLWESNLINRPPGKSVCLFLRGSVRTEGFILPPFLWVECRVEREKSWFHYSVDWGPPLRGFVMQEVSLGPHQQLLWVAESQITQFLRWGFQPPPSCILWKQPKKLLVKETKFVLHLCKFLYMRLLICRIHCVFAKQIFFISKEMSHLRQKIPILTLMNFITCVIGLSSSSGIECLPEKQRQVAVDQAY